ncbi:EGF-like domain-containing protein [Aphelenchoides besseyi]|nr:EGF-like domain-containing protein [Aphelenchoides besseyi]
MKRFLAFAFLLHRNVLAIHMSWVAETEVSLGRSVQLECEAHKMAVKSLYQPLTVRWLLNNEKTVIDDGQHFGRVMARDQLLFIYYAERNHNGNYTCRVDAAQNNDVLDCTHSQENEPYSYKDPCIYGRCELNSSNGIEILQCRCTAPYSGEHCDIFVSTVMFELLFYFPVIFHLILTAIFGVICCTGVRKRKTRITLSDDVVPPRKMPIEKMYVAAYRTDLPDDYNDGTRVEDVLNDVVYHVEQRNSRSSKRNNNFVTPIKTRKSP